MARVFIDGFEAGDLNLWDAQIGATVVNAQTGMDGVYCCELIHARDSIQKVLPSASEYYVSFRWRPIGPCIPLICFLNGATKLGYINRTGSSYLVYNLSAYRGSDNVLLGTTANSFPDATTYFIEVRFKSHNVSGVFQLKINGILVIDFSGNTSGVTLPITSFKLGDHGVGNGYASCYVDNIIVDNAAWPGNTKIQALVPIGAGNSTQWTPSAGANDECVDEIPGSETDYIFTNTADHLDLYAAGDLAGDVGAINCVQVQALTRFEGSPTPTNLQLAVRTNSTDYVSDDKPVPSSSVQLYNIWETNPDTEAAWAEAEVNALEIGVKAVA